MLLLHLGVFGRFLAVPLFGGPTQAGGHSGFCCQVDCKSGTAVSVVT